MKTKTKRILTAIICVLLALSMILPVLFTALSAEETPEEYTVYISNSVTSTSRPLRVTVEMGKTFTLPVCGIKNDDNDFGGWFCANDGSFYEENEVFENEDKLTEVVFYATWLPTPIIDSSGTLVDPTPEKVTVSFEAGLALAEGSLTVPAIEIKPEDVVYLPENDFTVDGYEFLGWQVGGVTLLPDMAITQINADLSVCAKWKPASTSSVASEATSSADTSSADTSSADTSSVNTSSEATSSEVTSSETASSLPVSSEPVSSETASTETSSNTESAPAASSQPEKKQYTIRLRPGHDDATGEEIVLGPFEEGTKFVFSVELHSTFSRSGYTFTGWTVGDETYVDGNYITVNGDITATAKWKKKSTSSQAAVSSQDIAPESYTDPTTGISIDGGLTFGTTMRVKKYTDKSVTDVYTAMLLKSKYLIVGYNIYVNSDISFTGGNLTIPVEIPEEDQDGAVVLYHVVGSKEVRLPKYNLDEFENKIVFDSSSGQPAVSWVDFTSDFPSEFALKVGEDRYAEIYIFRGDVEKLELEVSFLSPFLICRADAKYEAPSVPSEPTVSVDAPVVPEEPESPFTAPVIIALGIAVLCIVAIVLMRVLPAKQNREDEDDDILSSGK